MKDLVRVVTVSPMVHIGNPLKNVVEINNSIDKHLDADVLITPELSITGYTAQDMFFNSSLLTSSEEAVESIIQHLTEIYEKKNIAMVVSVGAPVSINSKLMNVSILLAYKGILGIVPKTHMPNYGEFYEKRWFSPFTVEGPIVIEYAGHLVEVSANSVFDITMNDKRFRLGIEVCEDLWAPIPPSSKLALAGAEIIINNSASNEIIGKATYRRELVKQQSARCISGYVYCSAGVSESTSDVVYGGKQIIAENGKVLAENKLFLRTDSFLKTDIDLGIIRHDRLMNKTFSESSGESGVCIIYKAMLGGTDKIKDMIRTISLTPFVPHSNIIERCNEIFDIQVTGLEARWRKLGSKCVVVGVSGGLDSTLALLVAVQASKNIYGDTSHVYGVTMPCFGTTDRTKNNAFKLMEELGCTIKEVNITKSVEQHLEDIGLSKEDRSIAYENAQARERTQVLMDLANMQGGFVIGTGDLSELALGWCTYNGDHMSMYSVNSSIPKTLVKTLVREIGNSIVGKENTVINDIVETPVSPELLPPSTDGSINQLTEDSVGPYILNDFFLYYTLRYGFEPLKILEYCTEAQIQHCGELVYDISTMVKWLEKFYKRFAKAQFKRNCCPDGVKVGSVSFSPRGDWRMPSEYDVDSLLEEVYNAENILMTRQY